MNPPTARCHLLVVVPRWSWPPPPTNRHRIFKNIQFSKECPSILLGTHPVYLCPTQSNPTTPWLARTHLGRNCPFRSTWNIDGSRYLELVKIVGNSKKCKRGVLKLHVLVHNRFLLQSWHRYSFIQRRNKRTKNERLAATLNISKAENQTEER
jgi:hypothetical protein